MKAVLCGAFVSGATCKLAWVLTSGKEKVTFDAVSPAVLKRDIYGSVLPDGG